MPNFKITETELNTRLDKQLYFIKHLEDFTTTPVIFKDNVFTQAFEKAELDSYEKSLKIYRDLKGVIDNAFDDGKTEGKMEGKLEVALKMKQKGLPLKDIAELTGLLEEEINNLQNLQKAPVFIGRLQFFLSVYTGLHAIA